MRGAAVESRIRARTEGEDEAFDEIFERVVSHHMIEMAESGSSLEGYYRSVKDSEPASSEKKAVLAAPPVAAAKQHRALTR